MNWFLLNSGPGHCAFNMAFDEALLEGMPRLGKPVLRFYGWVEPAASFGYFQKFAEVERLTHLRPLVRRPTGGAIVTHDRDWTYSLVVPTNHEWYELNALASSRQDNVLPVTNNTTCCRKVASSPGPPSDAGATACLSKARFSR